MIHYDNLKEDTRLLHHSEFVRKIISVYDLSDAQIDQLNKPTVKIIQHDSIDKIASFLKQSEHLVICGDYDADGVSATSIAYLLAKKLNKEKVGYYIPHRFDEGYGVSCNTIQLAHDKGYTDVLIVDTGVKAHDAVNLALSLGMRVAIVDHHLIEGTLPNCDILHPSFLESYANNMSAGGLMFVVAESMHLLDDKIMAYGAISTIGDVMPLWGKNREIVMRGLEVLNKRPLINIDALWKRYNAPYTAKTIGFQIVPKINAVGRMADRVNMNTMVQYLITDDETSIRHYANQVLKINTLRKEIGKDDAKHALSLIKDDPIHIVASEHFHEGLMGIVANQIMSKTGVPTLVLKEKKTVYKGSARSSSISLKDLFSKLNEKYFDGFGGHDFAFGLSVKKEYFDDFVKDVNQEILHLEAHHNLKPSIYCDFEITDKMIRDLYELEPFGEGFEVPTFMLSGFEIDDVVALNGYGYKCIFRNYYLKDAVIFNPNLSKETLMNIHAIYGTFDVHPRFGLSFSIDTFDV